jgi:hypothetical protein
MTPLFQYRDPLIGVLDYITEVRQHGYVRLFSSLLSELQRNARRIP